VIGVTAELTNIVTRLQWSACGAHQVALHCCADSFRPKRDSVCACRNSSPLL